jgi:hypothetical protein
MGRTVSGSSAERQHESSTGGAGNSTVMVVPCPTVLSTAMLPPMLSTIMKLTASPSPVPLPGSLVVKNGSKIFLRFS